MIDEGQEMTPDQVRDKTRELTDELWRALPMAWFGIFAAAMCVSALGLIFLIFPNGPIKPSPFLFAITAVAISLGVWASLPWFRALRNLDKHTRWLIEQTEELKKDKNVLTCPECEYRGLKSTVTVGITTSTALAGGDGYYDQEGVYRFREDPNLHTTHMRCSHGHEFYGHRQRGRRWLEWGPVGMKREATVKQ